MSFWASKSEGYTVCPGGGQLQREKYTSISLNTPTQNRISECKSQQSKYNKL